MQLLKTFNTSNSQNLFTKALEKNLGDIEKSLELTGDHLKIIYNSAIDVRNRAQFTPKDIDFIGFNQLHWAAITNQTEEIKKLIEVHNISPDQFSESTIDTLKHLSPLCLAAKHGHIAAINCFLSFNVNYCPETLSLFNNYNPITPFRMAVKHQQHQSVSLLALKEIEHYKTNHLNEEGFFSNKYTNKEKKDATEALENAIQNKIPTRKLQALRILHSPFKDEEKLKKIYSAYLAARQHEDKVAIQKDIDCECTLF